MLLPRRGFLAGSAGVLARASVARAATPLNILIIGGTGFVGPAQVEYALARGHRITLLNRNRRGDLFGGKVEQLVGDLNGDVSALKGHSFDVVIDNPTTAPAWVRNVAQNLKGRVGQYIFISTVGVYPDLSRRNIDETVATTPMPPGLDPYTSKPEYSGKFYYALKSFSEREVQKNYPGVSTIVRPGLIVGPRDDTDRFLYWVARIARGGTVLAPGAPSDPVQFIDARDLGEWIIRLAETRSFGTFNATGPEKPLTVAEMLYGIKAVTTAGAQFTWVPAKFLVGQKVVEWNDMPVWVDPAGGWGGLHHMNIGRALAAGLTFRSLAATAKDALDWHASRPEAARRRTEDAQRVGLSPAREAAVLAAWDAEQRAGRG
jgi:2'-hydroxyisoflavone reductase